MKEDKNEVNSLLEETKEYYRQRAPQYFDWAHDTGDYEGEEAPDASWFDEAKTALDALSASRLEGDVLEVASGTGILTEVLVKSATRVTALDSSQGMIERSKSKLKGNRKVRYILADFYDWTPKAAYDAVAFSFWISHVPKSKLNDFVSKVSRCLKPGGKVFFVDQREEAKKYESLDRPGSEITNRTLPDGRKFRVVKNFHSPDEIKECFLRNGIVLRISNTPIHFYYAEGVKGRQTTTGWLDQARLAQ